jgi:hypothetical protein
LIWNEEEHKISIGERRDSYGSYPGMPERVEFEVAYYGK